MYNLQVKDGRRWLDPDKCCYQILVTQAFDWLRWHVGELVRKGLVTYFDDLSVDQLAYDFAYAYDVTDYDDEVIPDDVYLWVIHFIEQLKGEQ